jgi:hypothetical protein
VHKGLLTMPVRGCIGNGDLPPNMNDVAFLFAFVVLTLASARLTQLVYWDKITFPVRMWMIKKFGEEGWLTYLVHCPYCVSVWTSFGATAFGIWQLQLPWWWLVPAALAMSYLVAPVLKNIFKVE